jgi:hypothetical protein
VHDARAEFMMWMEYLHHHLINGRRMGCYVVGGAPLHQLRWCIGVRDRSNRQVLLSEAKESMKIQTPAVG